MRWLVLFLTLTVAAHAAPPRPVIDLDFTRSDTVPGNVTVSRAASVTGFNCASPQALVTFGPNVAATHLCDSAGHSLGLSVWGQRIIQNGWARDLTQPPNLGLGQAGWTTTKATVAHNQTGIDLVANSASQITATTNNGTVCQSLAGQSAQYRVLTAYVRRITGTGGIWMSEDGGTHWTEVDGSINSAGYTRVPVGGLLQSVNGPNICFELSTSGDSIAVDYVNLQNDENTFLYTPSTPVLTTTIDFVIVPSDVITVPLAGVDVNNFTVVIKFDRPRWYGQAPVGISAGMFEVSDGTTSNVLEAYMQASALADLSNDDYATSIFYNGLNQGPKTRCSSVPSSELSYLTPPYPGSFSTVAIGYSTTTGLGIACNNGAGSGNEPETLSTVEGPLAPTLIAAGVLKTLQIGATNVLGGALSGYVQRVQVYNGRLMGGALTSIMAQLNPAQPERKPTYLLLKGGGHLLFTGAVQPTTGPIQCNQC